MCGLHDKYIAVCELDSVADCMSSGLCGLFQSHIRLLFGSFNFLQEATSWLLRTLGLVSDRTIQVFVEGFIFVFSSRRAKTFPAVCCPPSYAQSYTGFETNLGGRRGLLRSGHVLPSCCVDDKEARITLDRTPLTQFALLLYSYPAAEPALLEEDVFLESGLPVPRHASKYAPPPSLADGTQSSLGKRGREGAAADPGGAPSPAGGVAVDNPASDAGISEEDASNRRVRPHAAAAMNTAAAMSIVDGTDRDTPSETSQESDAGGTARGITEDDRMAATMAAIAKESSASVGEGVQKDSHSPDSDVDEGREAFHGALKGRGRDVGVGVDSVVQDVMRLAQSLKAARPSMSSEQLEEVDSLLRQTLKDVQERKDEEGESAPSAAMSRLN